MLTGINKALRREDIAFEDKNRALREDVRNLGALVGELVREQGGDELFELVEETRRRSIQRRSEHDEDSSKLYELIGDIDADLALDFIRSFSTYFQMVNTAEKVHRIRRRREYLLDVGEYQPGGLEDTLQKLKAAGVDATQLQSLLDGMAIEPVFTAHPTEPTRRTILRKEQKIVRHLIDMLNPTMTPGERHAAMQNIRLLMTTGWQTLEHPYEQMTVADELEHVLFFVTDVLYRAMPPLYENIEAAIGEIYGEDAANIRVPDVFKFASWVGGDMDGNPNVGAKTIRATLARQRSLVLDLYFNECGALSTKLSQSTHRVPCSEAILTKIEEYRAVFQNAYHAVPARHRDMPYRVFLRLVQERIKSTYQDDVFPYEDVSELHDDIQLVSDSLKEHRGMHAGQFAVSRFLRRIETYGFHLVTLDVRQDALVHRQVVGECLGEDDWLELSPLERTEKISAVLEGRAGLPETLSPQARKTMAVFQAIGFSRRKYGAQSIGPYIISMATDTDDVLSVLLLAQWADLYDRRGHLPLDIAPLFETVDDLVAGPGIMKKLLSSDIYRQHLAQRDDRQMVMIGYSDSNKDGGLASARWALQQAQIELVESVESQNVELTLFHGRGGTISRGGSKTHAAVLGAPPGTVNGKLRVTEQGEIINEKYGLRGIALRTLEQVFGSVALATALPRHHGNDKPEWHDMMQVISDESRAAYRKLVYETPGFFEYFRDATPIDVIERMRIGSRPSSRRDQQGVEDLRAIPWVFSWSQARYLLPGWFGLGTGIQRAAEQFGDEEFRAMFSEWYFMRALKADAEMVIAKSDLGIAELYSQLAGDSHNQFFPLIREEFDRTVSLLLEYSGQDSILAGDSILQRAILLRNPYIDPMSLLQVDLLRRWRNKGRRDQKLQDALFASVNGIASGLQNTG